MKLNLKCRFISELKFMLVNFYSVCFLPPALREGMLLINYVVCDEVAVEAMQSVQCIAVM